MSRLFRQLDNFGDVDEIEFHQRHRNSDEEGKVADMDCLPEALLGRQYIVPQEIGDEAAIKQRLDEAQAKKTTKQRKEDE